MPAPQNQQFIQGGAVVSGDALNTFIQWAGSVSGLRGFLTTVNGQVAQISGYTVPNDGGQGFFYWNPSSTAADDGGVTTVAPDGAGSQGRWIRLN